MIGARSIECQDQTGGVAVLGRDPQADSSLNLLVWRRVRIPSHPSGEGCIHIESRSAEAVIDPAVQVAEPTSHRFGRVVDVRAVDIVVIAAAHSGVETELLGPVKHPA